MKRKYRTIGDPSERFPITTPDVDLEGDRIDPLGADLSIYLANPIVAWLHDVYGSTESAGIPIATAAGLVVEPTGIYCMGLNWLEGDAFADRIRRAWDQGVVRGVSVGFVPLDGIRNKFGGHDITSWRLLEFSLVPVPANPAAVRP